MTATANDLSRQNVLVDIRDQVAWVTLNRPEKRNAISPALSSDMTNVLRALTLRSDVHVMVLTGSGPSFCAGMDLDAFGKLADEPVELAMVAHDARSWMWEGITRFPKPVIAMVNGYCFGGGFVPLIACDIAVAGSEAIFGLSEINWGHFLGGAVSKLAVDTMGRRLATYYALTGEKIDADTASKLGLVTMTVPQAELEQKVGSIALAVAGKSVVALQAIKEAIRVAPDMSIDQCYEYASAKSDQLRVRDKGNIRDTAREDFLKKKFRPGLDT